MKTYCAIDLELEQPKTNHQTPDSLLDVQKIIQIGYVIYKLQPEFTVILTKSLYINIGVPLSDFIKKLTGINDTDIKCGLTIEEAFNIFFSDIQTNMCSRGIIQWGGGDIEWLRSEVPGVDWKLGNSGVNVKHMFQAYADANNISPRGGLSKCLSKCGLKWIGNGKKHNAEYDALNTAQIHNFIYRQLKNK